MAAAIEAHQLHGIAGRARVHLPYEFLDRLDRIDPVARAVTEEHRRAGPECRRSDETRIGRRAEHDIAAHDPRHGRIACQTVAEKGAHRSAGDEHWRRWRAGVIMAD